MVLLKKKEKTKTKREPTMKRGMISMLGEFLPKAHGLTSSIKKRM